MQAKVIGYAYPSSTTATKNGFEKTGCYFIEIYKSERSLKVVAKSNFVQTKEEAFKIANEMPIPFHWMHGKYFNA